MDANQWSNTASINNPNLEQVEISDLVVGCYVFRWTVTNGACTPPSTFDDVQVCVFDDSQTEANAGPDQIICTPLTSTTLSANTIISPAVGTWTVISSPNTPTFSSNNANDASSSDLVVGTYVLEWCVDNGNCFNANTCDQVTIEVFFTDAPGADAGANRFVLHKMLYSWMAIIGQAVDNLDRCFRWGVIKSIRSRYRNYQYSSWN